MALHGVRAVRARCSRLLLLRLARGTIIKLNLGGADPDVSNERWRHSVDHRSMEMAATTGDQNTAVEYTGFLDIPFADINTSNGLVYHEQSRSQMGQPRLFGSLVIQNFVNGII